jgi:hypothetical protein
MTAPPAVRGRFVCSLCRAIGNLVTPPVTEPGTHPQLPERDREPHGGKAHQQPASSGGWSPWRETGHTDSPLTQDEAVSGVGSRRVFASSRRSLLAIVPADWGGWDPTFSVS